MTWFRVESAQLNQRTRPGASPGLWLAGLIPVGLLVNVLRQDVGREYQCIALASWAILCCQTPQLWRHLKPSEGRAGGGQWGPMALDVFSYLVTLAVVSFIFDGSTAVIGVQVALTPIAFIVPQLILRVLLKYLPKSFTIGEAAVVGQGLALFLFKSLVWDVLLQSAEDASEESNVRRLVQLGVLMIFLLIGVMTTLGPRIRNFFLFTGLAGITGLGIVAIPVTHPIPILFVVQFLLSDPQKILVLNIFIALVAVTGAFCYWHTASKRPTSTTIRKSFHMVIVLVFLIGVLYQRLLLFLCAGVTFALFLLLEAIRIAKVDHLSVVLEKTVKSFVDGQDSGVVALTPIYLLVGHAAPLFLTPLANSGGKDVILPLLSGVVSVGVGDSFAGLVGSLYGRHLWSGSRKSVEGTVANVFSQLMFIGLLMMGGFIPYWTTIPEYCLCIGGVVTNAIVEAKTDQVDNLVVPLVTFVFFSLI